MRFKYPTKEERIDAKKQWHNWFAWRPVRVRGEIVWLELIERRGLLVDQVYEIPYWRWLYKVK